MRSVNPNRKNLGDPQDFDFQVYTLAYKNKIKQDAKTLSVTMSIDTTAEPEEDSELSNVSRSVK
jgi:hypothetical protein